jgi:hypothetical protein
MSKMSSSLLDAMNRFVLEGYSGNGNGSAPSPPSPKQPKRVAPESYAAVSRS